MDNDIDNLYSSGYYPLLIVNCQLNYQLTNIAIAIEKINF